MTLSAMASCALILFAAPGRVGAKPQSVDAVLVTADAARDAHEWRAASSAYEQAYKLDRSSPTRELHLFNAAAALEREASACVAAAEMFRRFIQVCRACNERLLAAHRLLELEKRCPEAVSTWGKDLLPRERVTEIGRADIRAGAEAEARDSARRDAMKRILERSETQVKLRMSDTMESVLDGSKDDRFRQQIRQSIETEAAGILYDIRTVEERRDGGTFIVVLSAEIDNHRLIAESARIAAALAVERNPRLLFLFKETYVDRAGVTCAAPAGSRLL